MHNFIFVNTVKPMNDFLSPKSNNMLPSNGKENSEFSENGLYVREDDQDWGSAGMNDIQKSSE